MTRSDDWVRWDWPWLQLHRSAAPDELEEARYLGRTATGDSMRSAPGDFEAHIWPAQSADLDELSGAASFPSDAEPEVRRRLARELHDNVTSRLTEMLIGMEQVKRRQKDRGSMRSQLDAARSFAVELRMPGSKALLAVVDDGVGHEAIEEGGGGMGVSGMRERAVLVGGDLQILSTPGKGTRIQATFPLARLV